jgi:hypothetical protein
MWFYTKLGMWFCNIRIYIYMYVYIYMLMYPKLNGKCVIISQHIPRFVSPIFLSPLPLPWRLPPGSSIDSRRGSFESCHGMPWCRSYPSNFSVIHGRCECLWMSFLRSSWIGHQFFPIFMIFFWESVHCPAQAPFAPSLSRRSATKLGRSSDDVTGLRNGFEEWRRLLIRRNQCFWGWIRARIMFIFIF